MCFTIELHLTRKAIEERFTVDTSALYDFDFRYFYRAFSNPYLPVITQAQPHQIQMFQWGLIPGWTRNREMAERIRQGTYNARAESIHEKPSFREPFRQGRCLVIAHGFFEWQQINNARIPWYIRLKNNEPFAFAGLHDTWNDPDSGESVNSFSIITTYANPLLEKIHNTQKRMPVILPQKIETEWINGAISLRKASGLLVPIHEKALHAYTVSNRVSEKGTDPFDPDTLNPYDHPVTGTLF